MLPFRKLATADVKPFMNAVPLLDVKVAAGGFSPDQVVSDDLGEYDWVELTGRTKPAKDIFVAQVVGESMNRQIRNGAYCVWRLRPAGTRQGKTVLAQHRDLQDPESGARYTVKVYESEKEQFDDGTWRHRRIRLKPSSNDPSFGTLEFADLEEGELEIVAELVEVLT